MELRETKIKAPSKISKYVNIIISIAIYMALSISFKDVAEDRILIILGREISLQTFRGVITQLQMLISVYLVLTENKPGYIVSVILNIYSTMMAILFMINIKSPTALPGVISYVGVLSIITLIIFYKEKMTDYITEIVNQKKTLEESEIKLHRMAFYDLLTDLPNKELFINRLEQNIYLAKRNGSLIGVMFIDLDSFKSVNDTLGHSAGDTVLKTVAKRLENCLRKGDTVSRFSGDEFLVQISNIEKIEDMQKVSTKIMDIFKKPFHVQNIEFVITASSGVAVYPVDGEEPETLIKNADIAMYSVKSKGKNQCVYCSTKIKNDVVKKLKMKNHLHRALDNHELFIRYQPQVKADTKEIIGFEALLRWNNSEYGIVSPNVFIPLAETTGMIIPIGLWVFKTVCEQCEQCREIFQKDYRISINLSLEQLKDENFIKNISKILEDTNAIASNIQIEITENIAFNEEPYVLQRITELKNLGITIAIDDFGTGYSSFSRLKTFPIDLIKIDMEFIQGLSQNTHKEKEIVKSMIRLAKNLGIDVLAEGVETEEQYAFLRDEMCDEIQGFYFYKPMILEDIKSILYNQTN